MNFSDLPLTPEVLQGISSLGFTSPTPIQEKVIPLILKGKDVCGIAQTGSGKTGSYTIPILDKLGHSRRRHKLPRCLILVPTRELAQQVSQSFEEFGKGYTHLKHAVVIGGSSMPLQERALKKGIDIVIATPGRLLDHFERSNIIFHDVRTVVIDEADRMLDMGFVPDIEKIMSFVNLEKTQTLCFSATMPAPIQKLVDGLLKNPVRVEFENKLKPAESIQQIFVENAGFDRAKRSALRVLLKKEDIRQAIIFCNRKKDVSILKRSLSRYGFSAQELHGDLTQATRTKTLESFKKGEFDLLIASDVAARGIDIDTLPYVINFDIPTHPEEYVHRIGRTGRAGKTGKAITFIDDPDSLLFERIKNYIPQKRYTIDAECDLTIDLFAEVGYRKPNPTITNFSYSDKKVIGFGNAKPDFIDLIF